MIDFTQELCHTFVHLGGDKAYNAWNSVKDEYTKQRKKASGSDATPTWRFYNAMAFYSPVVDPRPGYPLTCTLLGALP